MTCDKTNPLIWIDLGLDLPQDCAISRIRYYCKITKITESTDYLVIIEDIEDTYYSYYSQYPLLFSPAVKLGQGKINLNYECNKPRLGHILLFFFKGDDFNLIINKQ
ncbi:hypothetical protein RIR_jg25661.t1 [Rhizophagus irregularis DAOM 181602=DAOM 197198]|nr:hypothetical protein RIR_jg25661.t1 [Rhizophagus irregularis DAOM 181602=DAOM 197198]